MNTTWNADGQSFIYGVPEQSEMECSWWRYDLATEEHQRIAAPYRLDPQLRAQFGFPEDQAAFLWSIGAFAPSGDNVLYSRLPPGYVHTPAPDDFSLPPYEAWVAKTDSSRASKVYESCFVTEAIWLDREDKVIFTCSSEGGWAEILLGDLEKRETRSLSHVFDGEYSNARMALSPDETRLAFSDNVFQLRIAALDGSDNIQVEAPCKFIYNPNWSPDSRRVYFQCDGHTDADDGLYRYDLKDNVATLFIRSPLTIIGESEVDIAGGGDFQLSPLENAATFYYGNLWLVTWSP